MFNVAAAFSSVQHTAVEAAVGQAELRAAVNQVFQNLARRNQSLLHRRLAMLDTLERKASDPDALADLFAIDHLTTRMRRHAEGLIILSGAAPGRGWRHPVGILDVLRGAIGEIEDYARVEVVSTAEEGIVGSAVADVIHLLAELIENAAVLSPPNTPVEVDAGPVGQGFVVEIQDRGLGMSPDKLAAVNAQLSREPEFDLTHGDQLGLFVVGTLAHRRGIKVALEPNAYGGLKTVVLLPHSLVVPVDRGGRADDTGTGPVDVIGHDTQEYAMDSVGRHRAGGTEPSGDREPLGMPSRPSRRPSRVFRPPRPRRSRRPLSRVPMRGCRAGCAARTWRRSCATPRRPPPRSGGRLDERRGPRSGAVRSWPRCRADGGGGGASRRPPSPPDVTRGTNDDGSIDDGR